MSDLLTTRLLAPVYLVVPTPAIGGTEKRLVGLWLYLRKQGHSNLFLVCPESLWTHLVAVEELADLEKHENAVHLTGDSMSALRRALGDIHQEFPKAVFHCAMVPPPLAMRFWTRRTVFTAPMASMKNYNRQGQLTSYAGFVLAGEVDFLNAEVRDDVVRKTPWRRSHYHVTPGSQIDCDFYTPLPFTQKTNTLAFLGLLSMPKQAPRMLECLPEVDRLLKASGIANPEFVFMGREADGIKFYEVCEKLKSSINVKAYFESNPKDVLRRSKVFFGVQRITNYPSRALLEAIACGALPVVTDVGDSRRIANDDFAWFVDGDFTAEQLADRCLKILRLNEQEFEEKVQKGRSFVQQRFSVEASAQYYLELYRKAAEYSR